MSPTRRKIIYAICFETFGVVLATTALLAMSDASTDQSLLVSVLSASVALLWSFCFNWLFEAWEARQTKKGRSLRRRTIHALLFETGLVVMLVPVMAWWLGVSLRQALVYEAGLIVLFIGYTYLFTYAFDRIFGLPASAR